MYSAPGPAASRKPRTPRRPEARRRVHPPRAPLLFPGWFVVLGAFLVVMVGFGAINSYGAFAEEIAAEFGSSRTSVSLIYALSGGACFLVSAISGPLADRVGPRMLAATGMIMVGLGLALAATARSLAEVLASYGLLIGVGVGFAYVPAMAVVQRWFLLHRGLASGLAASGIGIGTALVPPIAESLSPSGNWRVAFGLCGAGAAALGLVGAMLLRAPPAECGLAPDGLPRRAQPPDYDTGSAPSAVPPRPQERDLALAYAGVLLVSVPGSLPYAHIVLTARDLGVPSHDAVSLLGLIGIGSIVGRFVIAAMADVVGRRMTFLGCCAATAATMLLWAAAGSLLQLQVFALLFGAAHGGLVALLPAFIADGFGSRSIGRLLGLLYTGRGIALLAAPTATALGLAASGGHVVPVAGAAAFGGLGVVLLAALREAVPAHSRPAQKR